MNTLRKRVPFHFADESSSTDDFDEERVLDEQEQDELLQKLREENNKSNQQSLLILYAVIALSSCLHIIYLVIPTDTSPILVVFPSDHPSDLPQPLTVPLILLALFIHVNLFLKLHQRSFHNDIFPFSYPSLFCASAVAPSLCVIFGHHMWQTLLWWSLPFSVVWITRSVQGWMDQGNMGLLELEKLKYNALGA